MNSYRRRWCCSARDPDLSSVCLGEQAYESKLLTVFFFVCLFVCFSPPVLRVVCLRVCFTALAESLFSGLGLGAVVGLGLGALLLLLVLVDVSCFFLRHCGLLMCITRTLCSKKTATSGKGKEIEEGKAAYL